MNYWILETSIVTVDPVLFNTDVAEEMSLLFKSIPSICKILSPGLSAEDADPPVATLVTYILWNFV